MDLSFLSNPKYIVLAVLSISLIGVGGYFAFNVTFQGEVDSQYYTAGYNTVFHQDTDGNILRQIELDPEDRLNTISMDNQSLYVGSTMSELWKINRDSLEITEQANRGTNKDVNMFVYEDYIISTGFESGIAVSKLNKQLESTDNVDVGYTSSPTQHARDGYEIAFYDGSSVNILDTQEMNVTDSFDVGNNVEAMEYDEGIIYYQSGGDIMQYNTETDVPSTVTTGVSAEELDKLDNLYMWNGQGYNTHEFFSYNTDAGETDFSHIPVSDLTSLHEPNWDVSESDDTIIAPFYKSTVIESTNNNYDGPKNFQITPNKDVTVDIYAKGIKDGNQANLEISLSGTTVASTTVYNNKYGVAEDVTLTEGSEYTISTDGVYDSWENIQLNNKDMFDKTGGGRSGIREIMFIEDRQDIGMDTNFNEQFINGVGSRELVFDVAVSGDVYQVEDPIDDGGGDSGDGDSGGDSGSGDNTDDSDNTGDTGDSDTDNTNSTGGFTDTITGDFGSSSGGVASLAIMMFSITAIVVAYLYFNS